MSNNLKKLAADAAGVLRDDPELALEVGRELETHLEDKTDELRALGKTEAEAEDLARASFGALDEVAEGLLAANRRRMNLRGRARLVARFLLVPVAVLVAVWLWWDMGGLGVIRNMGYLGQNLGLGPDQSNDRRIDSMPADQRFLFTGDKSRPTKSAQMRAIWERYPDKAAYFGNYLTYLLMDVDSGKADLAFFEQEVRLGQKMDPDNARYSILLATVLVKKGTDWEKVAGDEDKKRLVVKDRQLLDRGMQELLRQPSLPPRISRGSGETLREQLALLAEPTFLEQINRIAVAAGMLMPDLSYYRNFCRVLPHYARLLAAEGRRDEAARVLQLWEPVAARLVGGAHTLIEVLVAKSLIGIAESDIAAACEELGLPELAKETRAKTARLSAIMPKQTDHGSDQKEIEIATRSGILGGMLMPALSRCGGQQILASITDKELAVSRWKEFVLSERYQLLCLVVVLLFLMFQTALVGFVCRLFSGARPLLLLPAWLDSLKILVYGVLAPVALYVLYSRFLPWAGRDQNLQPLRLLMETGLLIVALGAIPVILAGRLLARRCRELGITTRGWRWGTIARSLVPVYASAAILLGLLCGPYLRSAERDLVRQDHLMESAGYGFTTIESKVVQKLKADYGRVFREIAREEGK